MLGWLWLDQKWRVAILLLLGVVVTMDPRWIPVWVSRRHTVGGGVGSTVGTRLGERDHGALVKSISWWRQRRVAHDSSKP